VLLVKNWLHSFITAYITNVCERLQLIKMKIVFSLVLIAFILFANVDLAESGDTIEKAGDIGLFLLSGTALTMLFVHKDAAGALPFAESFATSMAATYGLKYTIHETRPNGGKHSFPSFHASSAFSGAAFIQQRYGWAYGIPAYLAASFVGYSRIESKNHHFGDVVAGAAIGVIPNLIFTKPYKDIPVIPSVGHNFVGITIGKNF
jgi:membrane-associated phospholipid phosphatase